MKVLETVTATPLCRKTIEPGAPELDDDISSKESISIVVATGMEEPLPFNFRELQGNAAETS